ncbi:AAA family ATPase [Paenibacillus sp. 1001270B_150601_E10]|uniref:AAA family ATPase n=1 Tax=Paenibacillus sp. 1001270B_150601_E10 TaxID=2787079 RepID=UPI0018A033A6|nr:ATP-binding protein [Paenibacillus sp. 1001270B_150601_E10]
MNIKSINVRGWRSFSSDEGVSIGDFKKINLIIGPNNAGKSNIFKYLFQIRNVITSASASRKRKDGLGEYDLLNSIPSAFNVSDTWSYEGQDIICNIQLEGIDSFNFEKEIPTLHQSKEINLKAHHMIGEGKSCFAVKYENDLCLLEEFKENNPKVLNPISMSYENPVEGVGYPLETVIYWRNFIESLVFVDPVRHHSRNSSEFIESDFDGSNIVQEIIRVRNEHDTEWREFKNCLEEWLKTILLEPSIVLDPTNDKLRFYIRRGTKEISASLENLGTGVSQLVMLLSYLHLNRERQLNVFIEEPESNLHPEAVVQLVKIMEDTFLNHRFFISTHSSILIDQVNSNWSIHRIYRRDVHASNIVPCTEVLEQYSLLDELGIRPSQLLQSNSVIWVEGPSDRTYLNKWIKDNSDLIEGKHYSFLMYGGANLANYDLIDNEDYINVLRTSRYSVIVCDSDKKHKDADLKGRVSKLIQRIAETTFDDGRSLKDYAYIWVTKGREIENYIPKSLLDDVLFSEEYLRKYVYVKTGTRERTRKNLKYTLDETSLGLYESFDEHYAKKYIFDDGCQLLPEQLTGIADDLSKKKASIAKSIVERWQLVHYSDELKKDIADLIEHIKKANYFGDI